MASLFSRVSLVVLLLLFPLLSFGCVDENLRDPNKKILVGYFHSLFKYSSSGANYSLPNGASHRLQLLEDELGDVISQYDVIVQSFLYPHNYINGTFIDDYNTKRIREGYRGGKGLKQICEERGVKLIISLGGGSAERFIPNDPNEYPAIVDALYSYVTTYGYSGIDIDEENVVETPNFQAFMIALGTKFHGDHTRNLTVSVAIGPLYNCFQSRGLCGTEDYIDWIFLMLYDGLSNSAAFGNRDGKTVWQNSEGQAFCGITARDSAKHGLVDAVAKGGCQWINYALYLNWPANKLVMGLPSYSYPNSLSWMQIVDMNLNISARDDVTLLTQYSNGEWIPSPEDITQRCSLVLDPQQSVLGVTLTDKFYKSSLLECSRRGLHKGATIKGAGFWQVGLEDYRHHQLSSAARRVINAINQGYSVIVHNSNYDSSSSDNDSGDVIQVGGNVDQSNGNSNNNNHNPNSSGGKTLILLN